MVNNSKFKIAEKFFYLLPLLLLFYHAALGQANKQVRQDIQQHFIPIDKDSPVLPVAIMEKLKGKQIVGIGEATHGTAEFEELFSRLAKSLIQENGFNVVVLAEANFYDTRALNDYVVYGKGDAETAIRHVRHSPNSFVEEEFKELAVWIRDYNQPLPESDRVWMLGADAMSPQGAAHDALRLCRQLNIQMPEEASQYLAELAVLHQSMFKSFTKKISLASALEKVALLKQALDQPEVVGKLSTEQQWLLQSTVTLEHAVSFMYDHYLYEKWSYKQFRDEAMLANIQWVQEVKPGAKLLVYAHNGHMEKTTGYKHAKGLYDARLGKLLHNTYGKDFYSICTEAQSGTYWAGDNNGIVSLLGRKNKVGEELGELVDAPFGFLELNATPKLSKYFNAARYITFGNLVGKNNYPAVKTINLAKAFDAVLYVRESTPKTRTEPKKELREFSLNLPLGRELIEESARHGQLTINLQATVATMGTSLSNEGAFLGLLFVDSQKNLLGYRSAQLTGTSGLLQAFPLPSGTEKVLLTVSGSNIKKLTVDELEINGVDVAVSDFKYYGEGYENTSEKVNGKDSNVLREKGNGNS